MHTLHYTDKIIAEKVKRIKAHKDMKSKPNTIDESKVNFNKTATFRYNLVKNIELTEKQKEDTSIKLYNFDYIPKKNSNYNFFTAFIFISFILSSTMILIFLKLFGIDGIFKILSDLI
ncbi:MAG: hypothetical protein ABF289_14150 [Clostridiales bacterium]